MLCLNLSFLEQDYPDYEVIVVDDQSIDSTKYVLKDFENYSNLKVLNWTTCKFTGWQKFIFSGIKTQNLIIYYTDAI